MQATMSFRLWWDGALNLWDRGPPTGRSVPGANSA